MRECYLRTFGRLPTQKHNGILSKCKRVNERSEYYPKNKMFGTRVVEALAQALLRLKKLLLGVIIVLRGVFD